MTCCIYKIPVATNYRIYGSHLDYRLHCTHLMLSIQHRVLLLLSVLFRSNASLITTADVWVSTGMLNIIRICYQVLCIARNSICISLWPHQVVGEATVEGRGSVSLGNGRWYPHQLCSQVAATHGSCVRAWDLRTMKPSWCVEAAHSQLVRSIRRLSLHIIH